MPLKRHNRSLFVTGTTTAIACTLGVLWLASRSVYAGSYLAGCLDRRHNPNSGRATLCAADTSKGNPTKCCKINDNGNIDHSDCGGVVITKTGYWCVKGDDYVGVYCKANPDGNSETCTDHGSPSATHYTPDCELYITSPSGARICADLERGLPQGFHCCGKIENGKIDESSCSRASAKPDGQSGTTTLTCASGNTLLACAPESALVTWCTPL